ncbi:MAG: response regulator [Dysgonamonadaceae bacterium]|jgi:signal transduction histidine kinase/DNA-binding response OmpR family regulator/ligand-binding sensor domain-containing protein|nr:response regulator [Dysgonamonadaceae bacterium]
MKLHIPLLLIAIVCSTVSRADNLRQISSRDGLSNSSVICLMQDNKRFLWIGTYDGLNMYDGREIHIYKPDVNNSGSLSSNVIRRVVETDGETLWLITKWGLNKFSQHSNSVEEYYHEFNEDSHFAKDRHNNLYVQGVKGCISWYSKRDRKFVHLPIDPDVVNTDVSGMVTDANAVIWMAYRGKLKRYAVNLTENTPVLTTLPDFEHPDAVDYIFDSDSGILIIDASGNIYNIAGDQKRFVGNINRVIQENGTVSSVIYDGNDILTGFKTNGLIRLSAANGYRPEAVNINCGVFSLWKDTVQDIVWVGTDGQGIYALTKDEPTLDGLLLSQLPIEKKRPVRAIQTDDAGDLWMGTKDNGIIRIRDYGTAQDYTSKNVVHYTTANALTNNTVFAFACHPGKALWIGSDGPHLDYYSYYDHKIHSLENRTSVKIRYVHSLFAAGDTLLWVGAGNELLKIRLRERNGRFETDDIKQYAFEVKYKQQYNQIYSLYSENDSIVWIGMRGNGAIRFNTRTEQSHYITFDDGGIAPMNDVLCIYRDSRQVFWIGTSYGLMRLTVTDDGRFERRNISESDGLPNNTIHGITEDASGRLWLSSNTGIILFDPQKWTFRNFNLKTGLKTIEYSDNAYFCDTSDFTCFFGGVDGITWIRSSNGVSKDFVPEIHFTGLRIFNEDYNIHRFEKIRRGQPCIELAHKQNFFAVGFVAMDFINGENNGYSYKLSNFSDVWMHTHSNEAPFTNIAPGDYTLLVKYNNADDKFVTSLHIRILPPWYRTLFSKIIYGVLLALAFYASYCYVKQLYKKRKMAVAHELAEKYKEEMYESKLRFFTNVTHEFCTPLTLIYGPCMKILEHENTDGSIKKYAGVIKSNAERLNSLIQEVIDFRRMETGNKICRIAHLDAGRVMKEITDAFTDMAESNKIKFHTDFDASMEWNSDESCFSKILNNLISNAFKYTPEGGEIALSANITQDNFILSVYNTGQGIAERDIPHIFNRYTVLDNITENSVKGLSSRNGLGLAICHSMTELLQGVIEVESEEHRYTRFTITLPRLETDTLPETAPDRDTQTPEKKQVSGTGTLFHTKILVIDDNKELLWMLKDLFADEYTVWTAENGEKGLEILKQDAPDLIITDIMMPDVDGITLTKQIKQNKHTMHIPLVILSAKNTGADTIAGIESGADAYISKPFDIHYLKTVVKHLLESKKKIETYYTTSASAFNFAGGQLIEKEDKNFLQKATEIIMDNLGNNNFTPDDLAKAMQTGPRKLYRKFNELELLPPKDYIKEQRIQYASRLLLTTTLTVEEIMYRCGFVNRSHFYKEFSKRMNQTPKEYRKSNKSKDESLS